MLFYNFLFIEKSESSKSWFPLKYEAAQLYNNKKCFLSTRSAYTWFLKDHVTLKTGVKAAENSALSSQEYITF